MSSRISSLLLGLGAAASLGACASIPEGGPPVASHADRHVIAVEQAGERLEVPVAPGGTMLDAQARANIESFASGYLRYGHGALILSTPSGNADADAASLTAHQARLALAEAGVPYAAIAGSSYDAANADGAPIILSFTRYEARAPECAPLWSQDLAHASNNQPWESFGCATQANLAAMVEDPHDLLEPRTMTARDSGRRDAVMEAYRQGDTTHADRTNDERVSISNVAQ